MRLTSPLLPALALGLTACNPFQNLPNNGYYGIDQVLWDPTSAVAAVDGVYITLPNARALARVKDDGTFDQVDLDGAEVVRMVANPDASKVFVWDRWPVCQDPDVKKADDCLDGELSYSYELTVVEDGQRQLVKSVPPYLNRLAFSPDGSTAVAYLDYTSGDDLPVDGVVDLTQVSFINLQTEDAPTSVSIGFSANNVIFSQDGARAVVLSRSSVVVVDLATFEKTVEYPLTLDANQQVDPSSAVLTPDGRYALITITGSSDLYKLDLDVEAIDIISLDAAPAALSVNTAMDKSVVVYSGLARADVIEHEYFDISTVPLDEPVTAVIPGSTFSLLYNDGSNTHDVYKLDIASLEATLYVMGNPLNDLLLTASEHYAVGVQRPENTYGSGLDGYQDSHWGLGVIDLVNDQDLSLVLQAEPVGTAVVEEADASYALVLLSGLDTLLQLDLSNPSVPLELALDAPPVGIGALPDGRFFITHDSPLGLVSFLDPAAGTLSSTAGFGALGLQTDDTLPRLDASN